MYSSIEESTTDNNQIFEKVKHNSPTQMNHGPTRYGTAATIPYEENFDLKSILSSKPVIPSNNNIMDLLKETKAQSHSRHDVDINTLLKDTKRDHERLLQVAKKAQQDFINSIIMD